MNVVVPAPNEVVVDQTEPGFVNVVCGPDAGPYVCPCGASSTLPECGAYELCPVCFWEDDGQDEHDVDLVRVGPDGSLSLTQARTNYLAVGASDRAFLGQGRRPLPKERAERR